MARSSAPPSMGPYLPPSMAGGNMAGTPAKGFPSPIGKSRTIQNLGNYTGQRTSGLTRALHGADQQFAHAFQHYGKPGGKDEV